ncbi:lipolytic protein G-D-S-L family [Gluconacetobacter diazotrophicus PA1 5]|uniref:Putative GDSL-like lipase/acylhydrolase n=1 Tax=Gluconacetobacter diazotrophicus (strain ATCC 49037 / DSM 5601 / CCUG 37298 / CIP 103539 / LMG 7603 / PAl5) TaxID=272568 RepID=A9HDY8_GLUDA|nr:arylesterase [Gluconacetobacter diazotrophicus]ACI51691.1 lipolytic protein G-D-S-L family [Gluconacetobacter diazotrophicus PA1 5]TWB11035.1 acyl-CoA thioesterase-1 [Gluconacetobacter diazotrophicus]CAP55162.1 putative GDSL-like lipase/acylhydrolase [Gluconacetobacter diazotrophicus PA1 5]
MARALFLWLILLPAAAMPARAADRPIRVLALGDSLTAGYGLAHADSFVPRLQAALDEKGGGITILDGGVSGDTSADALARLDWALGDAPDAAIVELGGNDGLRGLEPARMERNLTAILDRLRQAHVPVLLSGMYAPPNMGASYGQSFRAVFDRLSHRPGIMWDPFFLKGVAAHPELEQPDHIHPNPAGVGVIVQRLAPLVERLAQDARRS